MQEINDLPDTSIITEYKIKEYLMKDKEVLVAGDQRKIKAILPTYINKIIVFPDRVEANFKISVDDTVCICMVAASGVEPPTLRV